MRPSFSSNVQVHVLGCIQDGINSRIRAVDSRGIIAFLFFCHAGKEAAILTCVGRGICRLPLALDSLLDSILVIQKLELESDELGWLRPASAPWPTPTDGHVGSWVRWRRRGPFEPAPAS